jgi:4-amino-4-deoxy-L-arabinose transferase-like glycosyltransferase
LSTSRASARFAAYPLLIILLVALAGRVLLLASGSLSFHSDEAIIGLMARHILAGERPTFFFGQAYMGSLDAWLVALGFRLLGESVMTIRIVQAALYLGVVASAYFAAWVLARKTLAAVIAALTFAIAPPLLALYTSATLGGYNETLLFGHLIVALGLLAAHETRTVYWRWLLLGIIGGVGWWTNALVVVYALPVALYIFYRHAVVERRPLTRAQPLALGLIGFVIGSAPWWVYALQNDLAPIRFFLPDVLGSRETVGAVIPSIPFGERVIGLLLFGLPSVVGLRFPWAGDYFAPPIGVIVVVLVLIALYRMARGGVVVEGGRFVLFAMVGLVMALFLLTRFSSDPTGRYFLPLTLPVGVALGGLCAALPRRALAVGAGALVLGYYAAGQVAAANSDLGFTTQFVAQTHLPNDDDAALIAWLDEAGLQHGYTSYWVSFRLAFLSGERIQLSAALPDKSDLSYTAAFERYPSYRAATDAAEHIVYITANVPELDAALTAEWDAAGIAYQTVQIGIYRVYYDFAPTLPRP